MAGVDSILGIVIQQGADELRLGTDKAPRMFARGTPKKLALPPTPDDMLRHLLGAMLTPEREAQLAGAGRVDLVYSAAGVGAFAVTLTRRGDAEPLAFDAVLVRAQSASRPPPPPPPPGMETPSAPPPPVMPAAPLAEAPHRPEASLALVGLLGHAISLRASDVHLLDGEPPTTRVDGQLTTLSPVALDVSTLLDGCLDAEARARIAGGRSADVGFEVPEVGRFRMNVYRCTQGLAAAIRVLPRAAPPLSELRLAVNLSDLVELPHGLVIVSGPTGSGKSTTLAALAGEILRRRSALVISLEDPIEYALDPRGTRSIVRQRQVGRDVRDFPTGLRDALREDPDVLIIGEMRDMESISLALTAAETGHLVLTSLHSRSATSAVDRIVDAYPPGMTNQIRIQLAESLRAVIAQRLVPRARGGGRVAPIEVLRGTHSVATMIREAKTAQLSTVIQSSRKEGMLPLERCLADMVKSGEITADVARSVANDTGTLATFLQ